MFRAIAFLLVFYSQVVDEQISPEQFFGSSYTEALAMCQKQKEEFKKEFKNTNIAPELAMAVVFPELIRYDRFRNFFETSALELVYVNAGSSAADFSIGWFQMKPSFVEMLEKELVHSQIKIKNAKQFITFSDTSAKTKRKQRLNRLQNPKWQIRYLHLFIELVAIRFAKQIKENPEQELLILSTAYNKGLTASYEELLKASKLKTFPYGYRVKGDFTYYEVSNYFYNNNSEKILHH